MSMGKVTIYSIAQSLGLSASTVSRALTRPELVNSRVRAEVLERAREMGYQPNRAARGLATGHAGAIGLVVPDITNPYFPPLFRSLQTTAAVRSTMVLLADAEDAPDAYVPLVQRLRPQVDGLILASPRGTDDDLLSAIESTPTVFVNREVSGYSSVVYDTAPALRAAGDHLLRLGHRRFALLTGTPGSWAAQQRRQAIEEWAASVDVSLRVLGPFPAAYAGGKDATAGVLEVGATAAFAFDDLTACGLVAGLAETGVLVPRDCSVVGCDDVLLAQALTPTLSTIRTPPDDLGATAIRLLRDSIAGKPTERTKLLGEFVARHSTGPAPA